MAIKRTYSLSVHFSHSNSFLLVFILPFMAACKERQLVVSDSPGLVDFAIRLVNSVITLHDGQVKFFEEFKLQKNCEINLLIKTFLGLVEMMLGLVNVSFSLPEWQAVKVIFFAPCMVTNLLHYKNGFLLTKCFQKQATFCVV